MNLRRSADSSNMGGFISNKLKVRLSALDSWQFQKSGSFYRFVKNEVTVDVSGMNFIPLWLDYMATRDIISYGVGAPLLVQRSNGHARCHEIAGRVTKRSALFI